MRIFPESWAFLVTLLRTLRKVQFYSQWNKFDFNELYKNKLQQFFCNFHLLQQFDCKKLKHHNIHHNFFSKSCREISKILEGPDYITVLHHNLFLEIFQLHSQIEKFSPNTWRGPTVAHQPVNKTLILESRTRSLNVAVLMSSDCSDVFWCPRF